MLPSNAAVSLLVTSVGHKINTAYTLGLSGLPPKVTRNTPELTAYTTNKATNVSYFADWLATTKLTQLVEFLISRQNHEKKPIV